MQYDNLPEDKIYHYWKVRPPERQGMITRDELQSQLMQQKQNHACQWRQRGPEIFCDIGEFEHGKRIGTNKMLTGTDDKGLPILKNVVISDKN